MFVQRHGCNTEIQLYNRIRKKYVPGMKLDMSDFSNYMNVELKRWLEYQGLEHTGKWVELIKS